MKNKNQTVKNESKDSLNPIVNLNKLDYLEVKEMNRLMNEIETLFYMAKTQMAIYFNLCKAHNRLLGRNPTEAQLQESHDKTKDALKTYHYLHDRLDDLKKIVEFNNKMQEVYPSSPTGLIKLAPKSLAHLEMEKQIKNQSKK